MIKKIVSQLRTDDSSQTKVNMVKFYVNLFLLIGHIFLLFMYIMIGTRFMIIIDSIAIIIYLYYFTNCVKKPILYAKTAFFEIWAHMIAAVITFGWEPGFQNWTYGLIGAFFLPMISSTNDNKTIKRPYIAGLNFVLVYYVLALALNLYKLPVRHQLNLMYSHILFTFNTSITFFAIFCFTTFYASKHRTREDYLLRRADYDELTSLRNRHSMNDIISKKILKEDSFNIAIIDIDFFKKVNDIYGHSAGDMILRKVASNIRKLEKKGIITSRYGGEEFLIITPSTMDKKEFVKIMEKFRKDIRANTFKFNKSTIKITISAGISTYNESMDIHEAIDQADKNLYTAKNSGRNKVVH